MNPPSPEETRGDVVISVGPDGRLYFHDLDPELIEVALAVNPADELMRRRLALCRAEIASKQPKSGWAEISGQASAGIPAERGDERDAGASGIGAACRLETAP